MSGIALFDFTHDGSRNFAVWLRGTTDNLLVNEIGPYSGTTMDGVAAGEYLVDIIADGRWTLALREPRNQPAAAVPQNFTGSGDDVTSFMALNGLHIITASHAGSSNFALILRDVNGGWVDLVVNEIGAYSGANTVRVSAGSYVLEVVANGSWTIQVE